VECQHGDYHPFEALDVVSISACFAAVNLATVTKLPLMFRRVVEEAASGLRALLLKISPFESIKAEVQIP
jgi:hypothetical protein